MIPFASAGCKDCNSSGALKNGVALRSLTEYCNASGCEKTRSRNSHAQESTALKGDIRHTFVSHVSRYSSFTDQISSEGPIEGCLLTSIYRRAQVKDRTNYQ